MSETATFTAFAGHRRLATGSIEAVARALVAAGGGHAPAVVFDDTTGRVIDLDLRFGPAHAAADYSARTAPAEALAPGRARGRPRLGVVAREVTLLPRHWDWLAAQPGGASAALRRLVEEARRNSDGEPSRLSREAAYRVMSALGGDLPGFEEASRALFAEHRARLEGVLAEWPSDVRTYVLEVLKREADQPA